MARYCTGQGKGMFRKPLGNGDKSTNHIVIGRDNIGFITVYGLASAEVCFLITQNLDRHGQMMAVGNFDGLKEFYKEKCGDYPRAILAKDSKFVAKYIKKNQEYDPRKLIDFIARKTGLNCLIGTVPYKNNDERFAARNLPFMSQDKMNEFLETGKNKGE